MSNATNGTELNGQPVKQEYLTSGNYDLEVAFRLLLTLVPRGF